MTVNTQNITSGPYTGNNTSDVYDYTFRVDDKSELRVFETTATGVETELTVDVDYTVQDVGVAGGGTVTRLAGNLPTGYLWFIRSNRVPTQNTAFASQGGYFPQIHETALDKLTFLIQQLLELNDRTFRLSESDPNTENVNLMLPPVLDRANRTLVFDSDGNLAVGAALGTLRGAWQTATLYFPRDIFVDDGGTGNVYQVLLEHTSTNIADDLAADKIEVFIDIEIATDAAAAAIAAQTAAETAKGLAQAAETGAVAAKDAAEDAAALFTKATTEQAEAGADDVNYMTSLKTKEAITAQAPTIIDELAPAHIRGLVVTNNAVDLEHDIDISSGQYGSVKLDSSLTKRLDASFVSGTGNGGMVGSLPASGVIYIFLIQNGTSVDVYAETTNGSNPPSGWTIIKRIAVRITDASGNLQRVIVNGNGELLRVYPYSPAADWNVSSVSTTRLAYPISGVLSCPPNVDASISQHLASGSATSIIVTNLDAADVVPSNSVGDVTTTAEGSQNSNTTLVKVNSDRQIGVRRSGSSLSGGGGYAGRVVSWIEDRS